MKVAFLNLGQFVGGAERELVDSAVAMKEHYGVAVLAIIDATNVELAALLRANKVPFASIDVFLHREARVASRSLRNIRIVLTQARMLRGILERNDIDILMTYSFHSGVVGALARLSGMRTKLILGQVARRDLTRGGFLLEHLQYFAADGVTYNSGDLRQSFAALARRFPRPERIIYSYVKPPVVVVDERARLLAEHGLPDDTILVSYFGRIFEYKRVCDLIKAVGILNASAPGRNFLLVVGGSSQRSDYETYVRALAEEECPGRHCFLPFAEDPFPSMAACDVLVLPSVEPFGRVLVEAMYLGVPFVAVDRSGPKEIMALSDPRSGILVPPMRPDLIAQAIQAIASKGPKQKLSIPHALSRDGIIGGMLQFYRDILADVRSRRRGSVAGVAELGRDPAGS